MARPQRVTQRDVAATAGVSTATVSYVLSGRSNRVRGVAEQTAARVLAAVERTGYEIDHTARSLRRRRTDVVCLVYATPSNPAIEEAIDAFGPAAAAQGLTAVVLPITEDPNPVIRFLGGGYADGALFMPGSRVAPRSLRKLAAQGLAIATFDNTVAARRLDVVRMHKSEAQEMLIEYLADRGHRRFAFFVHEHDEVAGTDAGYGAAMARRGLRLDPALIFEVALDRAAAHDAARRLFARTRRPDVVVAASDRSAVQAIYAAHEAGLRIPGDVAVAGSGDIEEGRAARPALTTIGRRASDLGGAFDLLFNRVHSETPRRGQILDLPWTLIVRDSA